MFSLLVIKNARVLLFTSILLYIEKRGREITFDVLTTVTKKNAVSGM
jgi:hypothetical protein